MGIFNNPWTQTLERGCKRYFGFLPLLGTTDQDLEAKSGKNSHPQPALMNFHRAPSVGHVGFRVRFKYLLTFTKVFHECFVSPLQFKRIVQHFARKFLRVSSTLEGAHMKWPPFLEGAYGIVYKATNLVDFVFLVLSQSLFTKNKVSAHLALIVLSHTSGLSSQPLPFYQPISLGR